MNQAKKLAQALLDIKAVTLSPECPYTWASGLKSPIYCDNRITLAYPEVRQHITACLVSIILDKYPKVDVIAGTATAGIPQAALVAEKLNLPMIYVRAQHKTHGKANKIEGKLNHGETVVVIEDLISTGGSCIEACHSIQEAGGVVMGVVSNFTYNLDKGTTNFQEAGINYTAIATYDDLIAVALEKNYVSKEHIALLRKWRENPDTWLT